MALVLIGLMALDTAGLAVAGEDPAALGRELYVERCVLCHGSDGHGWEWTQKVAKPPVPVPNLAETVPALDDAELKRIILDGGEAVGRTPFMPAFRFRMSEAEVAALITYLRAITGDGKKW